jgi:hypothetical protein
VPIGSTEDWVERQKRTNKWSPAGRERPPTWLDVKHAVRRKRNTSAGSLSFGNRCCDTDVIASSVGKNPINQERRREAEQGLARCVLEFLGTSCRRVRNQ